MRWGDRWFAHVLLMLWLFVALGLAGCGRKSDLDPPSATAAPAAVEPTSQPSWRLPPTQAAPPPPPPRDRRFLLDPLLN